jgi:outer membrane lipoprotein-sorting protein
MQKWFITIIALFVLAAATPAQTPAAQAAQVLQQARAAIGSEAQLKTLTGLSASITSRRTIGGLHLERDLEYDILLPDKMRRRESRQPFTQVTVMQDEEAITYNVPNPVSGGGDLLRENSNDPQAQVRRRADFARMLLGLLLTTPYAAEVEYSYVGEHKEPDGTAEMIDVTGPEGFTVRLYIDRQTHRLLALSYRAKQLSHAMRAVARLGGNAAAQRPAREAKKLTPEQQAQQQVERWAETEKRRKQFEEALAQAPEVEYRWEFSEHKSVKGLTLPHRLTRSEAGYEYEEWEISAFRLNPKFTAASFGRKEK